MKRAGIAVTWLALACGHAGATSLRLGLPADPDYTTTLTQAVLHPYTLATHQKVVVVTLPTTTPLDLTLLEPIALDAACANGRLRKIDWGRLGGRSRFLPQASSDCGVGAFIRATVLTWDMKRVPNAPNWGDFWNVARMPGQRGLHRGPVGTLEIALMADGVAPRDVYAVLRGQSGVDRAFRKLDQLRPYIVWWQQDSEPMRIVAAGGALMSSAPADCVMATGRRLHRGFGMQPDGALTMVESWAIGGPSLRADAALGLIDRASDAKAQAAIQARAGLGGTLADDTAQLAGAVPFDAAFWRDNLAALNIRFDTWLKR